MAQKHKRFREFWTPFLLRVIRKNPRSMYARVSKVMARFVLKIEKLSHIMGPTPILEMARAYGLRPGLWLLVKPFKTAAITRDYFNWMPFLIHSLYRICVSFLTTYNHFWRSNEHTSITNTHACRRKPVYRAKITLVTKALPSQHSSGLCSAMMLCDGRNI